VRDVHGEDLTPQDERDLTVGVFPERPHLPVLSARFQLRDIQVHWSVSSFALYLIPICAGPGLSRRHFVTSGNGERMCVGKIQMRLRGRDAAVRLDNRDTKFVFSRGGGGSEGFGYAECLGHGFSTLENGWVGLDGNASQVMSGLQRRGSKASPD